MHHTLESPEVVDWVCRQLYPDEDSRELAAAAATSLVFHEQALNALWWSRDTIMNLIQCMPPDLWETVDVDVSTRALTTLVRHKIVHSVQHSDHFSDLLAQPFLRIEAKY
ncbi:hypothetical protein C8R45DRAFT_985585 [Mycena sanguinolenta]|nr:hypothetical protein C8R45DRAFT_985585 [Mycena sanguinolenta]